MTNNKNWQKSSWKYIVAFFILLWTPPPPPLNRDITCSKLYLNKNIREGKVLSLISINLRWIFSRKYLTIFSRYLLLRKTLSKMFKRFWIRLWNISILFILFRISVYIIICGSDMVYRFLSTISETKTLKKLHLKPISFHY